MYTTEHVVKCRHGIDNAKIAEDIQEYTGGWGEGKDVCVGHISLGICSNRPRITANSYCAAAEASDLSVRFFLRCRNDSTA